MKFDNLPKPNPQDKITMDVPLFIRVLERAREEIQSDVELHDMVEKITDLSAEGKTLEMSDYTDIVNHDNVEESMFTTVLNGMRELDEAGMMSFVATKPTQYRSPESQTKKHRVAVTVSDPDSTAVSQRGETVQKIIRVSGADQADAEKRAAEYYKRSGYRVHDVNYIGLLETQAVTELTTSTLDQYTKAANADYDKAKEQGDSKRVYKRGLNLMKAAGKKINNDVKAMQKARGVAEDNEKELTGFDAKTQYAIKALQAKYPHAPDLMSALLGDIDKFEVHSDSNDITHDKRLKDLENKLQELIRKNGLKEQDVAEVAPGALRAVGGVATAALTGIGGALIGQMFAPFLGATAGGIAGAIGGYKAGAGATDALWDKVVDLFGSKENAEQAAMVHAQAAAAGEKSFEFGGKKYPVTLKPQDAQKLNLEGVAEDKAGWSIKGSPKPAPKAPTPSWRLNKDGTATDLNTGITYKRDGSVVKTEEGMAESKFDPINDDDYYEYNVNTKEIVNHISGKHPEARRFNPLQRVWPGRDEDHKIVRGLTAKYLKKDVTENFNGISVNIEPELDYDVVQVMINGKKYDFNYWYDDSEKPETELELRKDIPVYLEREEWYNRLDFPTKMEVLHAVVQAELGNEPSEYKPTVDDEPMDEAKYTSYHDELTSRDRAEQNYMDQSKRAFKRAELQHELGHEDHPDFMRKQRQQQMDQDRGPWYIKIDGKVYTQKGEPKAFDWKRGANSYALAMIKNNPSLEGKLMLSKNTQGKTPSVDETKLDELTGWTQSKPKAPAKRKPNQPTAGEMLAKSNDKRSMLQRSKDAGNKNWFREQVEQYKKSQGN